jgi:hypothetical protein
MESSSSLSDSSDLSSIIEDDPSSSDEDYTERQRLPTHVKKATSLTTSKAIKKANTSRVEPTRKLRPQRTANNPVE